jgi:hypothetical protein
LLALQQAKERVGNLILLCSSSCIIHMDVVNADIAGANICPCRMTPIKNDFGFKKSV